MKMKSITAIKTAGEARQEAIDWQNWQSEQSLSYREMSDWQWYFETLAKKFNLADEFKENGVI
jgi:phospholipase C